MKYSGLKKEKNTSDVWPQIHLPLKIKIYRYIAQAQCTTENTQNVFKY